MTEKQHADLGASGAERWLACPGSINLSRGLPDYASDYSKRGNAAHNLAETCLKGDRDPLEFLDREMPDDEGGTVVVDEEMVESVTVFVNHVRLRWGLGVEYWIEHQFNLAELNPPEPMYGTADHAAYAPSIWTLFVDDYKDGVGVVKEAIENEQLMYYGIGVLLAIGTGKRVDRVVLTIVQPRAHHPDGIIRTWVTSPAELLDFAGLLFEGARRTQDPNAPLVPGPHCKFCKAAAICPALKSEAQALAQIEFEVLPEYGPPAPEALPIDTLADMVAKFHIFEDWMKAARAHLKREVESAGGEAFGHKIVERRKTRSWRDPEALEQFLRDKGYTPDDYKIEPELKSPAQIEKLVGKKNLPADLVQSKPSGYTLALKSDARPAVALNPGAEFPLLPVPPEETDQQ